MFDDCQQLPKADFCQVVLLLIVDILVHGRQHLNALRNEGGVELFHPAVGGEGDSHLDHVIESLNINVGVVHGGANYCCQLVGSEKKIRIMGPGHGGASAEAPSEGFGKMGKFSGEGKHRQ